MQRKGNSFVGGLIVAAAFLGIGYLVAFVFGKPILDDAWASSEWPSVAGTIKESEVRQERHEGKLHHSAGIHYEYQIDGQTLGGDTVWFGGNFSSTDSGSARKTVNRYPVGEQVDVYYNPEDPTNSVLEPGAHLSSYAVFGIGLAFLFVGVVVAGSLAFKIIAGGAMVGAVVFAGKRRQQTAYDSERSSPSPMLEETNTHPDDGFQIG